MNHESWTKLLGEWSKELLNADLADPLQGIPNYKPNWLGYPPATETQIVQAEARLRIILPPSYREFLKVSNGWCGVSLFIYKLWSVEEIDWLINRNLELIEAWEEYSSPISDEEYFTYGENQGYVRVEYLRTMLEISDEGNTAWIFLNPKVIFPNGEWEVWLFANWFPGARRYRSFWELMQGELDFYRQYHKR